MKDACPWRIFSQFRFVDGPPCFGILIEVLDAAGNEDPQIGILTVRFLATGDVRNVPCQSAPTVAQSQPIAGDWGITIPYVKQFFGQDGGGDQIYGAGDQLFIEFSELTDRAGMVSATLDKDTVDKLLYFDQHLGAGYEGRWLGSNLIRVSMKLL